MKIFVFNTKCLMRCVDEHGAEYNKELIGTAKEPYAEGKEEYIKSVAINGEYTIEDDGMPEEPVKPTDTERIAALEEELKVAKILLGVE